MQLIITTALLALSILYAGWRVYQAFQRASDPCARCSGCALKGKNMEKSLCKEKK